MPRYPTISQTPDRFDRDGNKLCRNCNNYIAKGRRNYCSRVCMDEFNRNNTWYFVRMDVLRRDNYKCNICKKRFRKSLLDVDHIIPMNITKENNANPFDKRNLRTLCKECHKAKTKLDRQMLRK